MWPNMWQRLSFALILALTLFGQAAFAQDTSELGPETVCDDGKDNDGDTVFDCGDNDCKGAANCKPDGNAESTNARCSDWVDNDEDGATDCDDSDCGAEHISVCKGSWKAAAPISPVAEGTQKENVSEDLPLTDGMTVQDLIGKGSDIDGERNDYVCSDGIDNDGDGKIDCADFGCRFDDSVTVCRGVPGLRFSVVGMATHSYDVEAEEYDTRISRLQLRAFGPIPQIQDSFFLISMLVDRTPRMTFAMFQIPIANSRHTVAINSGAAGLSQVQAISVHKQLFIDRPSLFRPMEQFNSAAVVFAGPLTEDGKLTYRVFGAGGSGRFDGNVGGRSIRTTNDNYPWGAGAQLGVNVVGYYSRFDTPFLYTPVPLTIGILAGAKYDERELERFVSFDVHAAVRWKRMILLVENYFKKEFEFDSIANSYIAQLGVLAIPKHLMLAVEWGELRAGEFGELPTRVTRTIRNQRDEQQFRVAAHWYFFRNIGVLSAVYRDRKSPENDFSVEERVQDFKIVAQYRF